VLFLQIKLVDGKEQDEHKPPTAKKIKKQNPVDLDLELVLGSMPSKVHMFVLPRNS
jgi:hypothetical protein